MTQRILLRSQSIPAAVVTEDHLDDGIVDAMRAHHALHVARHTALARRRVRNDGDSAHCDRARVAPDAIGQHPPHLRDGSNGVEAGASTGAA